MSSKNRKGKKNSVRDIIIIILLLMVLIMGGYLFYDKIGLNNSNNFSNMDNYKNYDGRYGVLKNLYFDDGTNGVKYYYVNLRLDGKVYYGDYNNDKDDILIKDDIVDIVSFANGAGDVLVYDIYMLDNNGNVYKTKMSDLIDEKKVVERVNVSDVNRLISIDWSLRENAGGKWAIVAITNDGDYIELVNSSV